MGSAFDARIIALAGCVVDSRTVCWTDSTFDGRGDERSKDDNHEFDLTWYVQGLLGGLGYDPGGTDGAFGNKTRTAIRAFQADIGIDETGAISDDLYMLLSKNGGVSYLMPAWSRSAKPSPRTRSREPSAPPTGRLPAARSAKSWACATRPCSASFSPTTSARTTRNVRCPR